MSQPYQKSEKASHSRGKETCNKYNPTRTYLIHITIKNQYEKVIRKTGWRREKTLQKKDIQINPSSINMKSSSIAFVIKEVLIKTTMTKGPWVAQSVKHPNVTSGHDLTDLMVHEFGPHIGLCTDSSEPASDSASPSLSAPPPPSLSKI